MYDKLLLMGKQMLVQWQYARHGMLLVHMIKAMVLVDQMVLRCDLNQRKIMMQMQV